MNEVEARNILGSDVKEDGRLHCGAPWVSWKPGDTSVELDGDFGALELRTIAYWMSRSAAPVPQASKDDLAHRIAAQVVQNVCELPDYTSPDDQPKLVMCTVHELEQCVLRAFEAITGEKSV